MERVERDASGHGDVCQDSGAGTQSAKVGGGLGEHSGGILGLQETLGCVDGV